VYFDDLEILHTSSNATLQADDFYPFGLPMENNAFLEASVEANRFLYQGKEWQTELGLNLYDFHARQFDPALGRWLAQDPQNQFASPYLGMGNMPSVSVDPDGEFAWFVPIIAGAILGGTSQGIAAANNGGNFLNGFWKGALVGAAAGATGIGVSAGLTSGVSFGAMASGVASAGFGASVGGGVAAGFVGGGLGASLNGGNFWKIAGMGALSGAIGAGFGGGINATGVRQGIGKIGLSAIASGLVSSFTGESFLSGFANGGIASGVGHVIGKVDAANTANKANNSSDFEFGIEFHDLGSITIEAAREGRWSDYISGWGNQYRAEQYASNPVYRGAVNAMNSWADITSQVMLTVATPPGLGIAGKALGRLTGFRRILAGFLTKNPSLRVQFHKHALSPIKGRGFPGSIKATHLNINKFHVIMNPRKWKALSNNPYLPFRF
jgi:RHS repeat-associated protein